MLAAQKNATDLCQRLLQHPSVETVLFPGLSECDPDSVVGTQMNGPGTMISFVLKDGYEAAREVMAAVKLITPAVSLGSCDTLIQHPAGLTHRIVDQKALTSSGIVPGLLRLSVGIEDCEDLWSDLSNALDSSIVRELLSAK